LGRCARADRDGDASCCSSTLVGQHHGTDAGQGRRIRRRRPIARAQEGRRRRWCRATTARCFRRREGRGRRRTCCGRCPRFPSPRAGRSTTLGRTVRSSCSTDGSRGRDVGDEVGESAVVCRTSTSALGHERGRDAFALRGSRTRSRWRSRPLIAASAITTAALRARLRTMLRNATAAPSR
jgi:hypothetical protein